MAGQNPLERLETLIELHSARLSLLLFQHHSGICFNGGEKVRVGTQPKDCGFRSIMSIGPGIV